MRDVHVFCPYRATEAEDGAIRDTNGFFFRIEWNDSENRAKDFFLCDPHIRLHIVENGGLDIETAGFFHDAFTAKRDLGTFFFANGDIIEHAFHLLLFDHRGHLCGWIKRMALRDLRFSHRCNLGNERIFDGTMRQHTRSGVAGLALIVIDRPGNRFCGFIEIRIGHNDLGALAAELESHTLDVAFGSVFEHQLADFG